MNQLYSSKDTSVNTKRLPAIYHKLWLAQLYKDIVLEKPVEDYGKPLLYDWGAGKETGHVKEYVERYGFQYLPYDPNYTGEVIMPKIPDVIICSNVLNVICEDSIVYRLHHTIKHLNSIYFICVYEGDKSGIGKETKKDCWQRNQTTDKYLFGSSDEVIRKKVITRAKYIRYITSKHN